MYALELLVQEFRRCSLVDVCECVRLLSDLQYSPHYLFLCIISLHFVVNVTRKVGVLQPALFISTGLPWLSCHRLAPRSP